MTNFASIQGDILSRAINAVGFSWDSSPIQTELELLTADWFAKMMGFPREFLNESKIGGGLAYTSGGEGVMASLVAAKHRFNATRPVIYVSDQTHVSAEKYGAILGYETRIIPAIWDTEVQNYPMSIPHLIEQIEKDKAAGLTPLYVCATFGTTNSCAIDPIESIGQICRKNNMWLHVDAAYAGNALICAEYRYLFTGFEYVDTIIVNASKWTGTGYGSTYMFIRNRQWLTDVFAKEADYMKRSEEANVDLRGFQVTFSRDNKAFRFWMLLSQYGVEGVQKIIRKHIELANLLEELIRKDDRFELCIKRIFPLTVFRLKGDDILTENLLEKLKSRKDIFLLGSRLGNKSVIRLSINSEIMEEIHIYNVWAIIQSLVS